MTFGLIGWLKSRYPQLKYEVPVCYPARDKPDAREWLATNGLGGYTMGTVSGAHRRRYHAVLASALAPPANRHIILSRVEEVLTIDDEEYELSTNYWASGVVSPTGYKFIESFTSKPCPTWVFEIDGNYLVKQIAHPWGTDEVHIGYYWLPDPDNQNLEAKITCKFLVGFRNAHAEVKGDAEKTYSQFVSPNQTVIILDEHARRLCLNWSDGLYESQKQWWWDFRYPTESIVGMPDTEDLYLVGTVTANLHMDKEFTIGASFDKPIHVPNCHNAIEKVIERQKSLIDMANLDGSRRSDMMLLACDQFLVTEGHDNGAETSVIEGYPWYNSAGRASMQALPGLTLATRRFDLARDIIQYFSARIESGIMANRFLDTEKLNGGPPATEYEGADVTLWWGWALYQYYKVTRDVELIKLQLPIMVKAAQDYVSGAATGVKVDGNDGLLRCALKDKEFSWMDTKIEGMPITPRSGKAVELCALWFNFLETIEYFAATIELNIDGMDGLAELSELARSSMQKFWNEDKGCLFDVIEKGLNPKGKNDDSVRCNQLIAVSLPFRAFKTDQEKSILRVVEEELLTPMGVRTLSSNDPSYQGVFGCGLEHPDQYHRDLSRHQGTAYPWLLGQYCEALINVYGPLPETVNRVRLTLQPLFDHFQEEDCLGSITEMFDGSRPQLPRGCPVSALSVAETMRWLRWIQKQ